MAWFPARKIDFLLRPTAESEFLMRGGRKCVERDRGRVELGGRRRRSNQNS